MITLSDIKEGAKFRTETGINWNVERIKNHSDFGLLVYTYMDGGDKGNYCDTIVDVVTILNEQKAVLI